jgi:D-beta-D-heptose 7-phosphate kinase/D-beta-D-heptose 1-phosphate adenosyltransferase
LANGVERRDGLVQSFARLDVIAIGDVILDRYWWGEASRLSPEAPVPVLLKRKETALPGGAANAAANAAALGARVELMGVVGEDREAHDLRYVLAEKHIGTTGLISSHTRPTTTKTRLIAEHQQLLRVDEEETDAIDAALAERVLGAFRERVDKVNAVIVSDYAKGLLTDYLLRELVRETTRAGKRIFIDPKGHDLARYRGASFLKPNRLELGILVGRAVKNHADTLVAARELRDRLGSTNVLVTEAADGMSYFGAEGEEFHVSSETQQVFDITGAGDTVIASFALAVAAGASIPEAMRVASLAAEITIARIGAATVSPSELSEALRRV